MSNESELWTEFLWENKLCGLCGNKGYVDTRDLVVSPAGVQCGVRRFCICPNGRALKKAADDESKREAK